MRGKIILVAALLILVGGFLLLRGSPQNTPRPVVLAAASLQESLEAAADEWEKQGHPRPVLSFAASSAMARQVEAGAPADLFISADTDWMDTLESKHLIRKDTRATLIENSLVLIAPVTSGVDLEPTTGFKLAQALGDGKLALADPAGVPAGRYAKQALESLGVWTSVSDRLAAADNVRSALALVAHGEAPLGIVYTTDAAAEPKVRIVATFPPETHKPIVYPIATLAASRNAEAADFRAFLLSPEGLAVFKRYRFTAPAPAS